MNSQVANQPRNREGKWIPTVKYLPDVIALNEVPSFPGFNESLADTESVQPYLRGEPCPPSYDEQGWEEGILLRSGHTNRPRIKPHETDELAWFEGPFNVVWNEMPELWEAMGALQGTEEEYHDLIASIAADLACAGDFDLSEERRNRNYMSDHVEMVELGIRYAGAMLGWPRTLNGLPMGMLGETRTQKLWPEVLSNYNRHFDCMNLVEESVVYARSVQLAIQKCVARQGYVEQDMPDKIAFKAIVPGQGSSAMPDALIGSNLSNLGMYQMRYGNDGNALLRYAATSESEYTSHIFEPNPATSLSWHRQKRGGYPNKHHKAFCRFSLNKKRYHAFCDAQEAQLYADGGCNWAEFALGRRTPPDTENLSPKLQTSFEALRIPFALYVITKCERGDPLRDKAETFVSDMGFEPLAAQQIHQMLKESPINQQDAQAGVQLAKAWREYYEHSDRDYSWYASPDDTQGHNVCLTPDALLAMAVERERLFLYRRNLI